MNQKAEPFERGKTLQSFAKGKVNNGCPLKSGQNSPKANFASGRKRSAYSTLFSDSIIFTFLTRLPSKKLTANEVTRVMAAEIR